MPLDTPSNPDPDNGPPATPRDFITTQTGWRIKGSRAVELLAEAREHTAQLTPGRDEDVLYAARFSVHALGGASPVLALLATLRDAIGEDLKDVPPLLPDRPLAQPATRFSGLSWRPTGQPGAWTAELLWRHPHSVVKGAPCTTHVIVSEHLGKGQLAVRVTADAGLPSVRGLVGAGQARPHFLSALSRNLRLRFDGGDVRPRELAACEIEGFVRDVLLSEQREYPVAVLAPLEEGGYVIDPGVLANELLGLAHVYHVDRHLSTFTLSDAVGDKRLSAYWGALRVYMPDFSCADRGDEHPLLLPDRLIDPVMRAHLVGSLGRFVGNRVRMPAGTAPVASPVPRPAATPAPPQAPVPAPSTSTTAAMTVTPAAATPAPSHPPLQVTLSPELLGLGSQLTDLAATLTRMAEMSAMLADEVARLRTATAVRAANTASLERRINSLEAMVRDSLRALRGEDTGAIDPAAPEPIDEDDIDGRSLVEVLRHAANRYSDALLILESAERSAEDSPYEDPERVAFILDAMADVARRRQDGTLGMSLKDAFREMGVDYRAGIAASTSKRQRQQYQAKGPDGRTYECEEHIALGGTYDPRRCLRIYFSSRAPVEARFVIGHVGRHFDVLTTS